MLVIIRLFQVLAVTLMCASLQAVIGPMLSSIIRHDIFADGGRGGVKEIWEQGFSFGPIFAVAFLTIFFQPLLSLALLFVLEIFDLASVKRRLPYIAAYSIAGFVGAMIATRSLGSGPSFAISYALAGVLAGLLHWWLVGRSAGSVDRIRGFLDGVRRRRASLCTYVILAIVAFTMADFAYYRAMLIWVSIVEPELGTPPFRTLRDRDFTAAHKLASIRFPDAGSCLTHSSRKPPPPEQFDDSWSRHLKSMDWTEIDRDAEAEVCIFRLLASYPDISYATDWLRAQGFTVGERFSSAKPYVERDGTLRVTGGWYIRANGPKFPTHGIISRSLGSIPYGMSVDATWSSDGKQLLGVEISYSTL